VVPVIDGISSIKLSTMVIIESVSSPDFCNDGWQLDLPIDTTLIDASINLQSTKNRDDGGITGEQDLQSPVYRIAYRIRFDSPAGVAQS
jgi:hypothetical protein